MIGSFGSIVFMASTKKILTFDDFKRSSNARWATHDVHLKYPIAEYLGPGQDTITFSMVFDVSFGVKPRNEMTKVLEKCRKGIPHKLIIGGVPLGAKQWYIESVNQKWEKFDGRGNLLRGAMDVTMKEYV